MILIVDDDRSVTASLALLLKQHGYAAVAAHSPDEALARLREERPRLVIQDMNFSRRTTGEEGLQLLSAIRAHDASIPVILITAWASVPLAVEGMKRGALDERYDFANIIGSDPKIVRMLDLVGRVAPTEASVLIAGESGTGKELVAEALHANSRRRNAPFVKVNLGGISTTLFESEMFGHVRGAFTDARQDRKGRFEIADGGTIFLDEIGELEPPSQVKLLRVLQERRYEVLGSSRTRSVDVRVLSATNRPLHELVQRGEFREDLLYG